MLRSEGETSQRAKGGQSIRVRVISAFGRFGSSSRQVSAVSAHNQSFRFCIRSQVTSISLANDNQRAIVGGTDSRVYVFDMRSGTLLRTIATTPHHCQVQCVKVTANDDFLVTAGKPRVPVCPCAVALLASL